MNRNYSMHYFLNDTYLFLSYKDHFSPFIRFDKVHIDMHIYTGVSISNRTDYFSNSSLMRRKLNLKFLPQILDDIGQRS
jgi:hypothetical protein